MTRIETASRQAPASTMTRTALVGWAAWSLFILTAGMVTTSALLDRYRGFCPGPGEVGRDWAFELFPFAQTCVVPDATPSATPMAHVQTALVYLFLIVAVAASIRLLTKSRFGSMSRLALSLVIAPLAGIAFAGIVLVFRLVTDDAPPPLNGIDLGLVWNLIAAWGIATAVTGMAFGIATLVRLGNGKT